MTWEGKAMGKYQFDALNVLAATSEPFVQFWELPTGVDPDVVARLAARGLIECHIRITDHGREQLSEATKIREENAAKAYRRNIREAMKLRKSLQASKARKSYMAKAFEKFQAEEKAKPPLTISAPSKARLMAGRA